MIVILFSRACWQFVPDAFLTGCHHRVDFVYVFQQDIFFLFRLVFQFLFSDRLGVLYRRSLLQQIVVAKALADFVGFTLCGFFPEDIYKFFGKFFLLKSQLPIDVSQRAFDCHGVHTMRRRLGYGFHVGASNSVFRCGITLLSKNKAVCSFDENYFFVVFVTSTKATARDPPAALAIDSGVSFKVGSVRSTKCLDVGSPLASGSSKTQTFQSQKACPYTFSLRQLSLLGGTSVGLRFGVLVDLEVNR
mmetsp:Transcript_21516/g.59771  ORF Transcript_21516/g.59771 Transcript_21516/m.59771 type:complete len:247 (-) Transcript_21516:156-896(-)